jgi:hypothetical protein
MHNEKDTDARQKQDAIDKRLRRLSEYISSRALRAPVCSLDDLIFSLYKSVT